MSRTWRKLIKRVTSVVISGVWSLNWDSEVVS